MGPRAGVTIGVFKAGVTMGDLKAGVTMGVSDAGVGKPGKILGVNLSLAPENAYDNTRLFWIISNNTG